MPSSVASASRLFRQAQSGGVEQTVGCRRNLFTVVQLFQPVFRNPPHAVIGAGQLAGDRGSGIGVIAQVGRSQNGRLEAVRVVKAPQRCFQRLHAVATAFDVCLGQTEEIATPN